MAFSARKGGIMIVWQDLHALNYRFPAALLQLRARSLLSKRLPYQDIDGDG